jgi:hypothetical protein
LLKSPSCARPLILTWRLSWCSFMCSDGSNSMNKKCKVTVLRQTLGGFISAVNEPFEWGIIVDNLKFALLNPLNFRNKLETSEISENQLYHVYQLFDLEISSFFLQL